RAARADPQRGDLPITIAALTGIVATLLAMLAGLWATRGAESIALWTYLVLYSMTVLAWPFRPDRFVVPLLPIVTTLILTGLWRVLDSIAARFSAAPRDQEAKRSSTIAERRPASESRQRKQRQHQADALNLRPAATVIVSFIGFSLFANGLTATYQ